MQSHLAVCCELAGLVHRSSCRPSTNMENARGTILSYSAMLLLLQTMQHCQMKIHGVDAIFVGTRRIGTSARCSTHHTSARPVCKTRDTPGQSRKARQLPYAQAQLCSILVGGRLRHSDGEELLGHKDVSTTMVYTQVLQHGGRGVRSPLDPRKAASSTTPEAPHPGPLPGGRGKLKLGHGEVSERTVADRLAYLSQQV